MAANEKPPAILSAAGMAAWKAEHGNVANDASEPIESKTTIWSLIEPSKGVAPLGRRNGVGFALLGWLKHSELGACQIKVLWFTIFFVPVLPIHAYVTIPQGAGHYTIEGELSLWRFLRIARWRIVPFLGTVLLESVLRALMFFAALAFAILVVWLVFDKILGWRLI